VALVELRPAGLYCPTGDFYIDPSEPVDRAVITHAHPDRVRSGSLSYLTAESGAALLREWITPEAPVETLPYGETLAIGEARVSLHPAGHILGSAQVRIEHRGEVWVVSGDYKLVPDPTCAPFEPVGCHTFVSESSFGLPIFRWPEEAEVFASIHAWWRGNREAGRASVVFAQPLGMAQRLMASLDASIGPIYAHPEIERFNRHYRAQGVSLAEIMAHPDGSSALVLAPHSAHGDAWLRQWPRASTAMASGWMRIRGPRRRRTLDRGFVLSSHADWPSLLAAIDTTRAETVWVIPGHAALARWLTEHGRTALLVEAHFAEDEA
jgi:putative mRNA 3-end processing factor